MVDTFLVESYNIFSSSYNCVPVWGDKSDLKVRAIVITNVIGPPGSGKTTYIRNEFGFSPPMQTIDDGVFEEFVRKDIFEHTGLNPRINQYLQTCGKDVTTIWFQTRMHVCVYRILKDLWLHKASWTQTKSRLKILSYYHRNYKQIVSDINRAGNQLVIIRTQSRISCFIRSIISARKSL